MKSLTLQIVCVGDSLTGWNNYGPVNCWPYPNLVAVNVGRWNTHFNLVGNILGTSLFSHKLRSVTR